MPGLQLSLPKSPAKSPTQGGTYLPLLSIHKSPSPSFDTSTVGSKNIEASGSAADSGANLKSKQILLRITSATKSGRWWKTRGIPKHSGTRLLRQIGHIGRIQLGLRLSDKNQSTLACPSSSDAPPSQLYHVEGHTLPIGGNIQISRTEIGSEQGHLRAQVKEVYNSTRAL